MRPNRLKIIAKERGITVADLLIEAYQKHGTQKGVAIELDLSQPRISQILKEENLIERTTLVKAVNQ